MIMDCILSYVSFLLALLAFQAASQDTTASQQQCVGFLHGVASGDPRPDSVILWTRFTPQDNTTAVPVQWFISKSSNATMPRPNGTVQAAPASDFTVKVDARGLEPGTRYYYFFQAGNYTSLMGTTRTAPAGSTNATIRFAQMSCASWRWGFFNVYNMTSRVADLDFIVFLGDWIYEYSDSEYPRQGQGVSGRAPLQPSNELATLQDYRTRHKLFHTDANLVEMMRRAPVIAVWDDHDVAADNAYANGTANPVSGVTYAERKCNGVQAYHEYMPIRSPNASSSTTACNGLTDIYRTFRFGNTMTLVMLEERLARDEQYNYSNSAYIQALQNNAPEEWNSLQNLSQLRASYYQDLENTTRQLIGPQQMERLRSDFSESADAGVTWQVLGNTVVMGPLNTPDVETAVNNRGFIARTLLSGILSTATSDLLEVVPASFGGSARVLVGTGRYHDPVIVDGWSGYQYERNQIFDILANNATNPVVLSGDIHNAFVWRLIPDNATTPVAIEFTTASVSAPGVDLLAQTLPGDTPTLMTVAEQGLQISNNNTMIFSNIRQRGAIFHTVNTSAWHADISFVETADQPGSAFGCQNAFELLPGAANEARNATCTPNNQLFFELYDARDPLRGYNLTTAAVPSSRLSSCPAEVLTGTTAANGDTGGGGGGVIGQVASALGIGPASSGSALKLHAGQLVLPALLGAWLVLVV